MDLGQGRINACMRAAARRTGAMVAAVLLPIGFAMPDTFSASAMQLPASPPATAKRLVQPVAVFGTDDRVTLPPRFKDVQQKIGLLFNLRSRTMCTAFCVAPNIVATAGHCMHRTMGERPPQPSDFWFARNYDVVRDYARIAGYAQGSAAQHVMSGSMSLNVRPPIDATKDWAFVKLSRPVCSKGVLPVRVLAPEQIMAEARADRVFQVSYHRDFTPWRLAYSRPCRVAKSFENADWNTIAQDFSEPGQLLLHTCDTGGVSSGSPLLLDTPDGPQVIGINVGTYVQSKVLMQDGKVTERLKAETVANTGVSAAVFAERLQLFKQASILAAAPQIRALQEGLKQRKFYTGPIDGLYKAGLRQAIEAFEQAHGLPVTGLATQGLLKRVLAADAERKAAVRAQKS